MMGEVVCLDCEEELEYVDTIIRKKTLLTVYSVYRCENEKCDHYMQIYRLLRDGTLLEGDPLGFY